MLSLSEPSNHLVGRAISELVTPATFFINDISTTQHDVICSFNGLNVIANRIALHDENHFNWCGH
ncbi:Sensor histidine kinase DpiB [Providencia stuartii]|nr:Sensor histidine kinase DpiB [Providencia stuartii]